MSPLVRENWFSRIIFRCDSEPKLQEHESWSKLLYLPARWLSMGYIFETCPRGFEGKEKLKVFLTMSFFMSCHFVQAIFELIRQEIMPAVQTNG
jgi:hypothetical protein